MLSKAEYEDALLKAHRLHVGVYRRVADKSDFRAVPDDLSLLQANQLTVSRIVTKSAPQPQPTEPETTRQQFRPE
jgi:hypothetical protein